MERSGEVLNCPICIRYTSDSLGDYFVNTSCGHVFHFSCLTKCFDNNYEVTACPSCNQRLTRQNLTKLNGFDPTGTCANQSFFNSQNGGPVATRLPTASGQYYEFEIAILGESGVGKSSLLNRYTAGEFNANQTATVGIEGRFQFIQIAGNLIKLNLWDISGREKYRCANQNHLNNSHGVIVVYSYNMTDVLGTQYWMDFVHQNGKPGVAKLLVGNMTDIQEGQRNILTRQGQKLADSFGGKFYETSARDFYNVEATFTALAVEILSKVETNQLEYTGPSRNDIIKSHEQHPMELQSAEKTSYFQSIRRFFNCLS